MIDFNEIVVKDKNSAFNNGKAGEAIAHMTVEAKKPTDKDKYPDWKVIFTDNEDRNLNEGFYYLDPGKYKTEDKFKAHLRYEAQRLKHIVTTFYGKEYEFPPFATPKDMLNGCMQLLQAKNNSTVKVGVTFGTVKRPSRNGWLQLKSSIPFITTNLEEELNFKDSDLMERPAPTKLEGTSPKQDLPWNTSF